MTWVIYVKGKIVEILALVIGEIRANPTHKIRWFNPDLKEAWRWIFPLTPLSVKLGRLLRSDPKWGAMKNPWWSHLTDVPKREEERKLVWESSPQIFPTLMLCVAKPGMSLSARRMLEDQPITTSFIGNQYAVKIIQVFQPTAIFNLHVMVEEKKIGVLKHYITMMPRIG